MLPTLTFLLLTSLTLPLPTLAALNGHCTGSKATGEWKSDGICIKTSTCKKYKGTTKNGACPYDPDDVKCCLIDECSGHPDGLLYHSRCEWKGGSICDDFGNWLDGEFIPVVVEGIGVGDRSADEEYLDKCPGGSNYKCCVSP